VGGVVEKTGNPNSIWYFAASYMALLVAATRNNLNSYIYKLYHTTSVTGCNKTRHKTVKNYHYNINTDTGSVLYTCTI